MFSIGESSLGLESDVGRLGGGGGDVSDEGVVVGGGLTISDNDPKVENIRNPS